MRHIIKWGKTSIAKKFQPDRSISELNSFTDKSPIIKQNNVVNEIRQ
ncbi:hypothetical protein [Flavobacterium crocinum]|nr:hypothetical protein [Flavobacterium crocinum]